MDPYYERSYIFKVLCNRWAGLDIVNDMTSPKQQKQPHHRQQKFKNTVSQEGDRPGEREREGYRASRLGLGGAIYTFFLL